MRQILITLYIITLIINNIYELLNIKNINNDKLFDNLSINTLSFGLALFYFKYNSLSISLLTIFIIVFINFIYIKDVDIKTQKTILKWFLILNIYFFIYGTLRYFFF